MKMYLPHMRKIIMWTVSLLSGRDVIGYASDKNTDSSRLEAHIKDILKKFL